MIEAHVEALAREFAGRVLALVREPAPRPAWWRAALAFLGRLLVTIIVVTGAVTLAVLYIGGC